MITKKLSKYEESRNLIGLFGLVASLSFVGNTIFDSNSRLSNIIILCVSFGYWYFRLSYFNSILFKENILSIIQFFYLENSSKKNVIIQNIYSIIFILSGLVALSLSYRHISCFPGLNECSLGIYWGGWDTKFSFLFRAYIMDYVPNPYEFMKKIFWASVDYPILFPSILSIFVAPNISFVFFIPLVSILINFYIISLLNQNVKNHFFKLLILAVFFSYPLYRILMNFMYADSLMAVLLLISFHHLLYRFDKEKFIIISAYLPLIKLEGNIYLLANLMILIFVFKVDLNFFIEFFKQNLFLLFCIFTMYILNYVNSSLYPPNQLQSLLIKDPHAMVSNLIKALKLIFSDPFRYFYLSLILLPFFNKKYYWFYGYIGIIICSYLYICARLPSVVGVDPYINVTLDRLNFQIFPLIMLFVIRSQYLEKLLNVLARRLVRVFD